MLVLWFHTNILFFKGKANTTAACSGDSECPPGRETDMHTVNVSGHRVGGCMGLWPGLGSLADINYVCTCAYW